MSNKKREVTLTERQWDHILIAMENSVVMNHRYINDADKNGSSYIGPLRSIERHEEIIQSIAVQLEWDTIVPKSSAWQLTLHNHD